MKVFWILMAVIGVAAALVLSGAFSGRGLQSSLRDRVAFDNAQADRAVSWQPPTPGASSASSLSSPPPSFPSLPSSPSSAAVAASSLPAGTGGGDGDPAGAEPDGAGGPEAWMAEAIAEIDVPPPSIARPQAGGLAASPTASGGGAAGFGLTPGASAPVGHMHQSPLAAPVDHPDVGAELDALLELRPEAPEDAAAHADRVRAAHEQALSDLAERYGVIAGDGSRERPYRIDWERLAAASRVYRPREGLAEIPPFIQQLDGAWIELAGYTLFSWSGLQIDEILLTRYMWDGCCIGVPPTPFTAVETRLKQPLERNDVWAMRSGIFVGRFEVDPYVQGEWLIALYVLNDAEMQPVF